MPEWVCAIEDEETLSDLRGQLHSAELSFQIESNPNSRIFSLGTIGGLKVEVFANEHPPPHFRVCYAGETANYRISDCAQINGGLKRHYNRVQRWHSKNKWKLIEEWNNRRPSDCPVGKYVSG